MSAEFIEFVRSQGIDPTLEEASLRSRQHLNLSNQKSAFRYQIYLDPDESQKVNLDLSSCGQPGPAIRTFVFVWEQEMRRRWSLADSFSTDFDIYCSAELEPGSHYSSTVFGHTSGSVARCALLVVQPLGETCEVSLFTILDCPPPFWAWWWRRGRICFWISSIITGFWMLLSRNEQEWKNGSWLAHTLYGLLGGYAGAFLALPILTGLFWDVGVDWFIYTRHKYKLEKNGDFKIIAQHALSAALSRFEEQYPQRDTKSDFDQSDGRSNSARFEVE